MNENQRRAARKAKRPAGYKDGGVIGAIGRLFGTEKSKMIDAGDAEAKAMGRGETTVPPPATETLQQRTLRKRLGEEK